MNICTQRRLARAPGLEFFHPFQFRDVRRDATNRVWLARTITEQKFCRDVHTFALKRGHGLLKLDRLAGFNHPSVVRAHRFGDHRRMNLKVGFAADLVALNLMEAFKIAVDPEVTKVDVLYENDSRSVVDNVL